MLIELKREIAASPSELFRNLTEVEYLLQWDPGLIEMSYSSGKPERGASYTVKYLIERADQNSSMTTEEEVTRTGRISRFQKDVAFSQQEEIEGIMNELHTNLQPTPNGTMVTFSTDVQTTNGLLKFILKYLPFIANYKLNHRLDALKKFTESGSQIKVKKKTKLTPKMLLMFFVFDAIMIAGVLYWYFVYNPSS